MSTQTATAIVTGASRGIGAAIARKLAVDGFQIVVNYVSSADEARALVAEIETAGGRAVSHHGDVADAAAVTAMFDRAESHFGPVDVIVNNAALSRPTLLAEVEDDDYKRVVEVNLTGAFNGMREGVRRIRDNGRIINITTSIIGWYQPMNSVYVATKAAVEAMTHTLAKELGTRRITVNGVAPGPTATEMMLAGRSEEFLERIISAIPLGRLGRPEEIAEVVAFLASAKSSWVNGQVIRVNGGRN